MSLNMSGKRYFRELVGILERECAGKEPVITKLSKNKVREPFLVLVGTLLSLRTKDELTEKIMKQLVLFIKTPNDLIDIPIEDLEKLIYPVGFYRTKARVLKNVARTIIDKYHGTIPSDIDELLTIKGIGRKTANLVVTEGFGKPGICVDTHVHRISNRLGIVTTTNPHETEFRLREILPPQYWIVFNSLLVTFGKNTCTPVSPQCTICAVFHLCARVAVNRHR